MLPLNSTVSADCAEAMLTGQARHSAASARDRASRLAFLLDCRPCPIISALPDFLAFDLTPTSSRYGELLNASTECGSRLNLDDSRAGKQAPIAYSCSAAR